MGAFTAAGLQSSGGEFYSTGYTDHGDQPPNTDRAIISAPTSAIAMPALLLVGVPSSSCSLRGGSSKEYRSIRRSIVGSREITVVKSTIRSG